MREIKFRAWDSPNKQMVIPESLCRMHFLDGEVSALMDWDEAIYLKDFILMQYTGLKDKNGKEIYEGDGVRVYSYKNHKGWWNLAIYGYIIFQDGGFFIKSKTEDQLIPIAEKAECIELWNGNIYENPELLAGG